MNHICNKLNQWKAYFKGMWLSFIYRLQVNLLKNSILDSMSLESFEDRIEIGCKKKASLSVDESEMKLCVTSQPKPDMIGTFYYDNVGKIFNFKSRVDITHRQAASIYLTKDFNLINGYPLREGNEISFGKVKFVVKKIRISTSTDPIICNDSDRTMIKHNLNESSHSMVYQADMNQSIIRGANKFKAPPCRYCFCNDNSNANPLLNICSCSGSMAFVHYKCLYNWIKPKLIINRIDHIKVVTLDSLVCELCKATYPSDFLYNKQVYSLIDEDESDKSFIVLEYSPTNAISGPKSYCYYLYFLGTNELRLGRHHDCEVTLNSDTVSREHAKLILWNNTIYLKDLGSRYGTSVSLPLDFPINNKGEYYVKCDSSILKVKIRYTCWKKFFCFALTRKLLDYNKIVQDFPSSIVALPEYNVDLKENYVEVTSIDSQSIEKEKVHVESDQVQAELSKGPEPEISLFDKGFNSVSDESNEIQDKSIQSINLDYANESELIKGIEQGRQFRMSLTTHPEIVLNKIEYEEEETNNKQDEEYHSLKTEAHSFHDNLPRIVQRKSKSASELKICLAAARIAYLVNY